MKGYKDDFGVMRKYRVDLRRLEVQTGSVEVTARSKNDARQKAQRMPVADMGDWSPEPHLTKHPSVQQVEEI